MRRLGILLGALGLLATPAAGGSPAETAPLALPSECATVVGNVADCTVPVPAEVGDLGAVTTRVRLVLPDPAPVGPLPVVYLLHGVGDTHRTWVDNTDVETFAAGLGALVVMPDGGGNPEAGWYSDWADGSRRWETFHTRVLIPWVDAHFPTHGDRAHRAVAGLSMGGFGAVSYAGRHPDLFAAAATFSGFLDTQTGGPGSGYTFGVLRPQFGTPAPGTWGDPLLDGDEWAAHNPTALARAGALDHLGGNLWLTTGTGTPGGPAGEGTPAGYGVEHYIWHTNQQFRLAALQAGLAFHDGSYLGGGHDWPHWQHALHRVLPELVAAIS